MGNFGFRYTLYNSISYDIYAVVSAILSNSLQLQVLQDTVIKQLTTPVIIDRTYAEYARGYMLLVNGTYDYELFCDDSCLVYQSTVANTTDRQYLRQILYYPNYASSYSNPYTRPTSNNHITLNYSATGYYYTEVYAINTAVLGFYRFNIITPPLQYLRSQLPFTPTNYSYAALPTPTYQIITYNITPDIRPEVIEVLVIRSQLGTANFTLTYGTSVSSAIKLGDDQGTFSSKISNMGSLSSYEPQVTLEMLTADSVPTSNVS